MDLCRRQTFVDKDFAERVGVFETVVIVLADTVDDRNMIEQVIHSSAARGSRQHALTSGDPVLAGH